MRAQFSNRNFYIMLAADAGLFAASLTLAYLFRFEFAPEPYFLRQLGAFLPLFVAVKLVFYYLFGLYRGMWRYTSFFELRRLVAAAFFSSLFLLGTMVFLMGFSGYSRSIFIIDGLLTIFLTGGLRLAIRLSFETGGVSLPSLVKKKGGQVPVRVLIIGAGRAGEQILREMLRNGGGRYRPVGFLDDDPEKSGRTVHGVPVLGGVNDLAAVAVKEEAVEALIAIPSARGTEMRRIVAACEAAGLRFKTLPGLSEIIDGRVSMKSLRDVNFLDLLGREPVDLETGRISGYLTDKVVLVTGCGGSIGSELCRQIIPFAPKLLILLDASEYSLYQIQMELHHDKRFTNYKTVLAQLQNKKLLDELFAETKPDVVFHAAAYKHVPLLELQPWEAVTNNIVSTRELLDTALAHEVKRFVLVSTDKAVRPTNVMGASKRVTELLLQARRGGKTKLMSVRFGNVIGSSGSVIPLFMNQIASGGPVTVTHPEVTRYFMTIPEAAQLILQAGSMGGEGEIFILKMGKPVVIADMARDLIRLAGKEPDTEIEIRFIGMREGEKMHEELITMGEGVAPTSHGKIMLLTADDLYGFGSPKALGERLSGHLDQLLALARDFDGPGIRKKLKEIVPEYEPGEAKTVIHGISETKAKDEAS